MRDRESPGSSDSRVAQAVSAFYEHHPYPPPVDDLERYRKAWTHDRRRADAHVFWPSERYRDDRSILVAGCGTSQAAKHAVRWPRARVTGIDFSATSVRCTEALKRKYKLDNLDLHQLAVERAGELGTQL
jgi:trans-aconitate methyltransferase